MFFVVVFSHFFCLLIPYYKHWIQVQVYYITSQSISVFSAFFRKNFSCNISVPYYYFNKTTILLMSYTISGHLTICLLVCVYVFLRRCRVDRYLNFFFQGSRIFYSSWCYRSIIDYEWMIISLYEYHMEQG